jgi:catechol 2,3-dioxygenase-like lactoylglutathione lyase family enzyme
MVDDVDEAVTFYRGHLGFDLEFQPGPGFAIISRGDLRLMLNTPGGPGGAAQPMPDGRKPEPGGWNRIQLEVENIEATVNSLRADGVQFRNDVQSGRGGKQILLDDPSGNPVELFQPAPD